MRRVLSFECQSQQLVATLDEAVGTTGLLIVSGGNEIRVGAHRGMAKLAADIAQAGHPVFRFDRRGVGDSEGDNGGFESSGPDIAAAVAAFRSECPALARIVAFGNCDAASALALHRPSGIDALVLANPWVIERHDDLPPPAAIRARYRQKMRDPRAWLGLLTGAVDLGKLRGGLARLIRPVTPSSLSHSVAQELTAFEGMVTILIANRDATAIAFADEWSKAGFAAARAKTSVRLSQLESASHSFAGDADYAALKKEVVAALAQ